MNFINLRNVAGQEINQSYCGILRITPYEIDDVKFDDPTPLLYNIGKPLDLSDSDGNYLNITFTPEIFPTEIINEENKSEVVNLINIRQNIEKLFCTNSLNIKQTLYISTEKGKAPLQIINDNGVLLFPIETPEDDNYINYNNILNFNLQTNPSDKQIKKAFDDIPANSPIYTEGTEYEKYHVKINGKKIYRFKPKSEIDETDVNAMVPEIYHHDYILGQCAGHTYKTSNMETVSKFTSINDSVDKDLNYVTELSFIEVEKIIWSLLSGSVGGSYRSFDGRYKQLFPIGQYSSSMGTENNLWKELFVGSNVTDDEILEDKIRNNAPLVGLPVQPGLIMYNAIPFRRFLFHTLRRDQNLYNSDYVTSAKIKKLEPVEGEDTRPAEILSTMITVPEIMPSLFMHNLTSEYVLCNGKRIKEGNETDYPSINKRSTAWSTWEGDSSIIKTTYDAISKSMNINENGVIRTPRLFELNQYASRFLRGLNWQRCAKFSQFINEPEERVIEEDNIKKGKWPYNPDTMVLEADESFIINDWYNGHSTVKPHVVNDESYPFTFDIENNPHPYQVPNTDVDDEANIPKDIHKIGIYYGNYDYKLSPVYRHVHQPVVNSDLLEDNDKLYSVKPYYCGESESNKPGNSTWEPYVKLETPKFLGTYAMRSIQGLGITDKNLIRKIQDLPISYRGGTTSAIREVKGGHKVARVKWGRCLGNANKSETWMYADGGYELAAWQPRGDSKKEGWRLLSSLPVFNKYGSWKDANDYATAVYNGTTIKIDDSLPNPPSINLLPLMKI